MYKLRAENGAGPTPRRGRTSSGRKKKFLDILSHETISLSQAEKALKKAPGSLFPCSY